MKTSTKVCNVLMLAALAALGMQSAKAVDWPYSYAPTSLMNCASLNPHDNRRAVRLCAKIQKQRKAAYPGNFDAYVWVPKHNDWPFKWQDAESKLIVLNRICDSKFARLDRYRKSLKPKGKRHVNRRKATERQLDRLETLKVEKRWACR